MVHFLFFDAYIRYLVVLVAVLVLRQYTLSLSQLKCLLCNYSEEA